MADVATLVFDIDSSQARTAATDLAKVNDAAARAARGAENLNRTLRDQNGRFRSSVDVANQYGNEVQRLAAKYNPALNAVYKYQQAQLELNRAVMLGVLTQQQADSTLAGIAAGMQRATTAANGYTSGMRGVNNIQASVGNQFAQLNDVVVTAWGGMNPALIGMQQGMQIVQGFAGQSLPQALGTLKGAFAQILNPTTILTVGLVAGAAALVQWGASALGAESDAKTFDDTLSDLEGRISEIGKLNKLLNVDGIEDMRDAYGATTVQVRELIAAQKFLAKELAVGELKTLIDSLAKDTGTTLLQSLFGDTSGGVTVPQQIIDAENRIANLRETLKLTEGDAKSLGWAFEQVFSAGNVNAQLSALSRLREYLTIIAQSGREGADEAKKMLENVIAAEKAAGLLKHTASGLPATFAAAASAASKITEELNRAISAAGRLAVAGLDDVAVSEINLRYRTDPVGRAGALAALQFEQEVLREIAKSGGELAADERRYLDLKREETIARARNAAAINLEIDALNKADRDAERSVTSGAAELRSAEKGFLSLRELLEKESLFQVAEYEKRQAQLDVALAKKLLSEQNYQEMRKQLQMMYFGSEYEINAVNYALDLEQLDQAFAAKLLSEEQYLMKRRQLQWDYMAQADSTNANLLSQELSNWGAHFGDMNRLAGGGYDGLIRMQKSFAAASALINTWLGYTKALAEGPPMTPWMRLAWAGKILAAGIGAVNAIKGSGKGSSASTATAAAKAEPQRSVLVRLEGDEWLTGMAEQIMTEIYEQTGNGRVVVQRDYS